MKRHFEQTSSFSVNKKHHADKEDELAISLEKLQTTDSDLSLIHI